MDPGTPRIVDLAAVDLAVETLLESLEGYTLIDRLEMDAAQALPKTRLGATSGETRGALFYALGESTNDTGSSRQRYFSDAESVLTVHLWTRTNPHQQRADRRAALTAETVLRQMLTDRGWCGANGLRVTYTGTPTRAIQQEAFHAELRFTVVHTIRIGNAS